MDELVVIRRHIPEISVGRLYCRRPGADNSLVSSAIRHPAGNTLRIPVGQQSRKQGFTNRRVTGVGSQVTQFLRIFGQVEQLQREAVTIVQFVALGPDHALLDRHPAGPGGRCVGAILRIGLAEPRRGRIQRRQQEAAPIDVKRPEGLLERSDFLAMAVPLGEQTRRLIDADRLRRMKPTAYLINVARGEVMDEADLVRALREGWIAGAGIDVYEREPPEANNPQFTLGNVILGSHNLAYSDEMNASANRSVTNAVLSLAAGRIPETLVNPEVLDHADVAESPVHAIWSIPLDRGVVSEPR